MSEQSRQLVYSQLVQKAQKSYDDLYYKYGIQPNAWIMSIDAYYRLTQDYEFIPVSKHSSGIAPSTFMGNPIHIVTQLSTETIKAVIEMEE